MTLKQLFPHEEYDFSPWLASHEKILSDIIGDTVRLHKTETHIGDFYIDITMKDSNNKIVPIENQFGTSDHAHLGKVISYATLLNSDKVVWIADSFRQEHKRVLSKLAIDLILVTFDFEKNKNDNYNLRVTTYSKKGTNTYGYNNLKI